MKVLAELQYFSPLSVFKCSILATDIFFRIYEDSFKMSFRNRCIIAGANGLIHLSVPLEGGRDQVKPMKDLKIANNQSWQKDHWRTIASSYNRSPYFEFYKEELELFFQKNFKFL